MPWIQEINFRSSSGFRSDDSSDAYVQTATSANYPTTTSQGNDVGWETSTVEGAQNAHNAASGKDVRLAGAHFKDALRNYRIDLPNTGDFRIRVSGGEHDYSEAVKIEIFDTSTSRGVLCNQAFAQHGCVDAQDVEYSEANWPGSNSWSDTITFTTTICRFRISASGYWGIMHITIEEVATGVTVALTGQAMTAGLGSLGLSRSKALIGSQISAQQGSFALKKSIAMLGEAIAMQQGSFNVSHSVPLVGQEITGALGTVVASIGGDVSVALTGIAMTGSLGTLGVSRSKPITGQEITAALGVFGVASSKGLTGSALISALGSLGVGRSKALVGQEITGQLGSFTKAFSKALSGIEFTAQQGTFGVKHLKALSGLEIVSAQGSFGIIIGSDVTVALTGMAMTAYLGEFAIINTGAGGLEGVDPLWRRRARWAKDQKRLQRVRTDHAGFSNRKINVTIRRK